MQDERLVKDDENFNSDSLSSNSFGKLIKDKIRKMKMIKYVDKKTC